MTRHDIGWVISGVVLAALWAARPSAADEPQRASPPAESKASPREYSGIYPHLAMFNDEGECGTGAVVPWADRLWVVTYGPHLPNGSSDKLYEITRDLRATIRPESIGGTPANRLIHRESNQLFIGPYAIDAQRNVRVIPYRVMPGRHTATMRHLTDSAGKVYYATMEEGLYEVDVRSLEVRMLYPDQNDGRREGAATLPGYHGKGAYTGQGRVVYANNGEASPEARRRPDVPSGCLAEWDGREWRVVRRNQFCDVTGPGGILGNEKPETDPIWSIGWDHRSLILMVLDQGRWQSFRLPKASHCYDGAHGWNTEWPRIREIGEDDLLMTMHGAFWRFPRGFDASHAAGIRPRSTYLKVVGDFARWGDRIVFGCDDAAKSEFLNRRKIKGDQAATGQSQSNLWFVEPAALDRFGPAIGRGAVWLHDAPKAGEWSEPFLLAGYDHRVGLLLHGESEPFAVEVQRDPDGSGRWETFDRIQLGREPGDSAQAEFTEDERGEWIRLRVDRDCRDVTAIFHYWNDDPRGNQPDPRFEGLATLDEAKHATVLGGVMRCASGNRRILQLAATRITAGQVEDVGYYELDEQLRLRRKDDTAAHEAMKRGVAIPSGFLTVDAASVLYVDDAGRRWRLPKGDPAMDAWTGTGLARMDREVVTERDLMNCHGTFYELPAEYSGGTAKIRPIATHNRPIVDYCSYRGLLVLTGVSADPASGANNPHIIRSDDGRAAVWVGAIDDLWALGRSRGRGGPCHETPLGAGQPSDPYLLGGFVCKSLTVKYDGPEQMHLRVEIDPTGQGDWFCFRRLWLKSGETREVFFTPPATGYWLRCVPEADATVTMTVNYE